MNVNNGLPLVQPRIAPVLDPDFRPAVLANRAFRAAAQDDPKALHVGLALDQNPTSISHFHCLIPSQGASPKDAVFTYVERIVKFLLWARGGYRLHVAGPQWLADRLQAHFRDMPTGRFDSDMVCQKMFDRPIEVLSVRELPPEKRNAAPLGRHLDGCRIGFDLGGSDRKVAALVDGKVVFSNETVWDPYFQPDPQYHFDGIMDSLQQAAKHLPRVDAIGGSAAGVYVGNRVKVASLFRGVSPELFKSRVRDLFMEIKQAYHAVPLDVVNDGEVTALAGSMSLGRNRILGISLGTSTAGGYVDAEGCITTWLNELAFVPVDYNPAAPKDEWSGDRGCGVQYFSQQCVGRLLGPAGIEVESGLKLPEKLKHVQKLMDQGDARARRIYETIGTYLGYGVAHFADFYGLENVLILGRVTSGPGGDIILTGAKKVLETEFPELNRSIQFHIPDEQEKRHGQAIAAASLPVLK